MTAVVDTSPLIVLARSRLLHLLDGLHGPIEIPEAVRLEALDRRPSAPEVNEILRAIESGLVVVNAFAGTGRLPGLGLGESAVIALGSSLELAIVGIDDKLGRSTAERLRLHVVGTVGILMQARERNLIPAVSPILAAMRTAGFRVSNRLVDAAIADDPS